MKISLDISTFFSNADVRNNYRDLIEEVIGRTTPPLLTQIIEAIKASKAQAELKRSLNGILRANNINSAQSVNLSTQLWEISPNNPKIAKKVQDSPDRSILTSLMKPRMTFPGTSFSLPPITQEITRDCFDYFMQSKDILSGEDKKFIQSGDNDENASRQYIQKLKEKASKQPEILDPSSDKFEINAWYFLKYRTIGAEYFSLPSLRGQELINKTREYFNAIARSLNEVEPPNITEFFDRLSSNPQVATWEVVKEGVAAELSKIYIKHGFLLTVGHEGQAYEGKIVRTSEKIIESPNGLKVPVAYTYRMAYGGGDAFGDLGAGRALHGKAYISLDNLFNFDKTKIASEHFRKHFMRLISDKPKFSEVPKLLVAWLNAFGFQKTFSELSTKDALKLYEDHILAEEFAHIEAEAFAKARILSLGRPFDNLTTDSQEIETVRALIEPDSFIHRIFNNTSLFNRNGPNSNEFAKAIIELEGDLKSITQTPFPLINLHEYLGNILFPINRLLVTNDSNSYDLSRLLMVKVLTESLIPNGPELTSGVDWSQLLLTTRSNPRAALDPIRQAWYKFFDDNLATIQQTQDPAILNKIRGAAKQAHDREFLSDEKRNQLVPNWFQSAEN